MVARKKHYRPAGKKKEGNAARFCTRSQAVKQLQINLPLFRKLCILKGIFPREPKKKVKGNHHTYYHLKDILFIQHDPLVQQMRDIRAYGKKVKKATAKKNKDRAVVLQKRRPTYKLDHVILQRYPTFIDALRDLDDCLTMVHLFAFLPAIEDRIEVKRIQNCRRMSHEWQAFISRTHKLRKVFVSVKGIYYQAEVKGQMITWLTPHPLQQVLTEDIDFNIMLNFLEFYEALLAFVNCHLYRSINVKYPPILDPRLEAFAAELYALSRYFDASSRSSELDPQVSTLPGTGKVAESELRLAQLQYQLPSNEAGALTSLVENVSGEEEEDNDTLVCKGLFKDMKIFLNREVNRESLLFVIPAFGGMVSWKGDGAPFEEEDNSITHQIVDRPLQHELFEGRKYVQPQWVYDCVNAKKILPTQDYLAGRVLPPHLSPFVDPKEEGYVPDYALKIEQWKTAQILPLPDVGKEDLVDPQDIADIEKAKEAAKNEKKLKALQEKYFEGLKEEVKGVPGSTSISEADNLSAKLNESTEEPGPKKIKGDDDRDLKLKSKKKKGQNEAMKGVPASTSISEPDPDFELIKPDEDERHLKLMSKRKRGLYEAMKINKERKKDSVELILKRKRNLEESQKTKK